MVRCLLCTSKNQSIAFHGTVGGDDLIEADQNFQSEAVWKDL